MPTNGEEKCVICSEAITNPICLNCVSEGMEAWFSTKNPALIKSLRLWTRVFDAYTHEGIKCAICGGNMNVCSHCYTEEILDAFKDGIEDMEGFEKAFLYTFGEEVS
jgi:hypothetical protein